MLNHYKSAFFQIINFLESLEETTGAKYYLVGGILVNIYSDFRTTRDIDIALDLFNSDINLKAYSNLLEKNKFHPIQDWITTTSLAQETGIIQFLDKTETVRYDNHLIAKRSVDKYKKIGIIALERRERRIIFNKECWVASKEDFILSKLVFGGWQDYSDALGCWLRFKTDLNLSYLQQKSKELDIKKEYNLLISGIKDPDIYFQKLNNY